ncbi:MAG: cytochrome c [Opitutaceae bacterium]|jgi:mono/diheme cytochrome c family protein
MRTVYLVTAFLVVAAISILGFRGALFTSPPFEVFPDELFPGMKRQPKPKPQGPSAFFADGRADRLPPPGTVPHSQPLRDDDALYLGKNPDGSWVRGFPAAIAVDASLLERGRDRYTIYCSPCHGAVGDGNGVTKRYGMGATPSYHDDRLRQMAEGEIFNVITNGKAPVFNMSPYADKLDPGDRWAVVAYVRALQRAQMGTVDDVPAEHRQELGIK